MLRSFALATTLLAALIIVASSGCSGAGGKSGKRRIAVIPKGTTHDFWKSVHAGALKAAEETGVEIIWKASPSEEDKEAQIKLIDSLVVDGVDGICVAPIDRSALVAPIERAKKMNVPTVVFDSGLEDADSIVSYVATNNRHGGEMAGEYLAKVMGGKGNVILLRYAAGSESTEQREAGFLDAIKKFPDIKVLDDTQRAGSDGEEALQKASSLLLTFDKQVDGVFTVCEPNNKGMLQALENRELAGKVKFVGFDSDPRFIAALKDGKMDGIILQDPFEMGYRSVKAMVDHLDGKTVEKTISTGEYLATRENMDEPKIKEVLSPKQAD